MSSSYLILVNLSDGKFGEYMQVHIQNDGPVTIELESPTAPIDSKQVSVIGVVRHLSYSKMICLLI